MAYFGIAATLLVVRISVDAPGRDLGRALVHAWPQYVAYGVSFLMIGIWWVNHHAFMKFIDRVDRVFLFTNIGMLASIAFIPFPTNLVAEHFHDNGLRAAVILYGLTLTLTACFMTSLWFYAAVGRRLIVPTTDQRVVDGISRYALPGPIGAGVATLIALWNPYVTLALIATTALYHVFGGSPTKSADKTMRASQNDDPTVSPSDESSSPTSPG
jgi:TMEM175 potassium channel family protein